MCLKFLGNLNHASSSCVSYCLVVLKLRHFLHFLHFSSSHSSLPPPPPPPPSNSQQPQQQQQKPAKPVFQTGPTATTVNTSQAIASSQALLMTSLTLAQTMTSSSPVATVTKKQVKPTTPGLPHTVTRALVTPEMKQREKVAAATAKPGEKKSKDVATPTGAFLEGGEMVPAPMVSVGH